ncbi:uncharacterized protein [Euwallacea fornicatus]|uniref:uncharacterized protein n=1 Tax=Euwallacea fornicatus TaxID=995702 RepID=UPI00339020A7
MPLVKGIFGVLAIPSFLALVRLLQPVHSPNTLIITGQVECEHGYESSLKVLLDTHLEVDLQLDPYGIFHLKVPENQSLTMRVLHPHCNFDPVAVKTSVEGGEMSRFVYLSGRPKIGICWWMLKCFHNVTAMRKGDVESLGETLRRD